MGETCDICGEETAFFVTCPNCEVIMCEDCAADQHEAPNGEWCSSVGEEKSDA